MARTEQKISTQAARGRSGPVLYELIDKDSKTYHMQFTSALGAADFARRMWPDQEQDEDRTGKGWDVQVVGCDR